MSTTFADLGVPTNLVRALAAQEIIEPFPVQTATIPDGLAGRDICGRAPTGSGKTLAFGIPLVAGLQRAEPRKPPALVLAPTRELAEQIMKDLLPLATASKVRVHAIFGGVSFGPQKNALRKGVDIVVACPGRLEDLVQQRELSLDAVERVVLDEADRMADMGFLPAVKRILDRTAKDRQTTMFSATIDHTIDVLARDYQRDPVRHDAGGIENEDSGEVTHFVWKVGREKRTEMTAEVVEATRRAIVFMRTRHSADRLTKRLAGQGIAALAVHGGLSQKARSRALADFTAGRVDALIATDVATRGIHVHDVRCIVHFDVAEDEKDFQHRSGRTGRAGASGMVVSFVERGETGKVTKFLRAAGVDAKITDPDLALLYRRVGYRCTDRHP